MAVVVGVAVAVTCVVVAAACVAVATACVVVAAVGAVLFSLDVSTRDSVLDSAAQAGIRKRSPITNNKYFMLLPL